MLRSRHVLLADLPAVLQEWHAVCPSLGLLVLLPEAEAGSVSAIQAACAAQGVPVLGAIFPALIVEGSFVNDGAWLIPFEGLPPHFMIGALPDGGAPARTRLGEALRQLPLADAAARSTLFLIFDAMLPNISSLLSDIYHELGSAVEYGGVNAGSETFQPVPCLFDGTTLLGYGVLGLLLPDTHLAVAHGYPVARTLMRATSTTGNRIKQIDGRPALEVYQEVIAADFGVVLTPENFYDYAVHYPFGVVLASDVVVRIPVAFDEAGTLVCVGDVPPDSLLRLIKAPTLEESDCVAELAGAIHPPAADGAAELMTFYCAGRRMHFGAAAASELAALATATGGRPLFGALSLGEITSLEGFGLPQFHNAAIVCLT